YLEKSSKAQIHALKNQLLAFNLHNLAFEFLTMLIRLKTLKVQRFQCRRMFNTASLVSQKAASSL
ncbi:hypothetical protein DDN80_19040, partial [Vibrio cholerae]|uniref:hypothetical protein n=1 Tax=Vibrio cholerae TaxID=666 RepID=UPI001EBD5B57|nr:hypothetical protein [Vibrio cholerae]